MLQFVKFFLMSTLNDKNHLLYIYIYKSIFISKLYTFRLFELRQFLGHIKANYLTIFFSTIY